MSLIGVDVGGTFTDVFYTHADTGAVYRYKTPTTPDNPALGVVQGVLALCERHDISPSSITHFMHGTTIATNAVLEFRGAKTGMLTTSGYRDILHIGRHQRPQHYSIAQSIPWQDRPLVRRRFRRTVDERLAPPTGETVVPLDEAMVAEAARKLRDDGVEAIAICFLFSYLDDKHERRAKDIVSDIFPECFVTTSASVAPQFREFERFTTAAMNAFIGPKVRDYVEALDQSLNEAGVNARFHVMGSHGGAATAARVREYPILTLLSGPAAGVLGGAWTGQLSGERNLITFDVGGTSADIGLVINGVFSEASARDTDVAGYPVLSPMIDIHTIGAGGGSIAHLDAGGGFKVGPQSAGAKPGPAAYGQGGTLPTVTDAQVVLGRLRSEHFLDGEMPLDENAARQTIARFGDDLGMSMHEAASGILRIVNANMANAIRSRTVQKGLDPREFTLVAFGGAGPLSAVDVAQLLNASKVIVPHYPGLTSALGLLTTDLRYDEVRTAFQASDSVNIERLNQDVVAMEEALRSRFERKADLRIACSGDLRYAGQGYELRVEFPDPPLSEVSLARVFERFHQAHFAEYGHRFDDAVIEIVNIRSTGTLEVPKISAPPASDIASDDPSAGEDAVRATKECYFDVGGATVAHATAFVRREVIPVGIHHDGPAIIIQPDTTVVIPPLNRYVVDEAGNLIIELGAST
ncbi:MAG: hydantoinase/oxoprolinase family protein [Pseudomonadota bacterium]